MFFPTTLPTKRTFWTTLPVQKIWKCLVPASGIEKKPAHHRARTQRSIACLKRSPTFGSGGDAAELYLVKCAWERRSNLKQPRER